MSAQPQRNPASLYTLETELARISELVYELQRLVEKDPNKLDTIQLEENDLSRAEMEQELEALQLAYEQALLESTHKRDAMAYAIRQQEREAEFAAEEAQRLQQRARGFKASAKRLKDLTLGIIFSLPKDGKGKYQVLKGQYSTLRSWKNSQPTVVASALEAVAPEYKMAMVHMPADIWERVVSEMTQETEDRFELARKCGNAGVEAELRPSWIVEAIKAGGTVEGAHLEEGYHLRIV
jgi:Siphovirus Gp157